MAGVFGLGSLRWPGGREEVKPKSPATGGGEGSDGIVGVSGFGSLRWPGGREEVKETSSTIEGQPATKIPKIPKIPIIVDVFGKSNDSRNTSREQTYNQTEKKIIRLYIIVNDC